MTFLSEFIDLPLENLHEQAAVMKGEKWRFIQTHAVYTDDGVDLYYSFMKDGVVRNYRVKGVQKGMPVPSITDLFLAAFVFENEARELFGVDMRDIAIDFAGNQYAPAESEPMTIITPEQKAAREKARKAAAAKAAKESGDDTSAPSAPRRGFVMTEEKRQRLEAKLATMSPEKVAKVRAALAAREAEAAAADAPAAPAPETKEAPAERPAEAVEATPAVDSELDSKIEGMDPAKAAKVRAALGMDSATGTPASTQDTANEPAQDLGSTLDAELATKLAAMDPQKAEKVRAALKAREGQAASKGGE